MKIVRINSKRHGQYDVLVDDEDFDRVVKFTWRITKSNLSGVLYASSLRRAGSKVIWFQMHRLIMRNPKSQIDHIDGNGLNNQKSNLRLATCSQNRMNTGKYKNNTTGFKGVFLCKNTNRYRVLIRFNKKQICGGRFDDRNQAAKKYNELALKYHGEFARLNIITK